MHIALKAIHLLNNYTKTDKTVMTKTFKINEEIIFYNNTIEFENFKKIKDEILHKIDNLPFSGSTNTNVYLTLERKEIGRAILVGTAREDHFEAFKNQIDEIRAQIKHNNQ